MPNTKKSPDDILLQDDMMLFWTFENKGWALRVHRDDEPQDPRRDYDNITTMACFHRRHSLGDKLEQKTPGEFWDHLLRENVKNGKLLAMLQQHKIPGFTEFAADEDLEWGNPEELLEAFHNAVYDGERLDFAMAALKDSIACLPMWMYEHSGITVSCGERAYPYNDQFDSSAIGWCVLEKSKAMSELQADEKNWREKAEDLIRADVQTYDTYLQGDCWYYELMSCPGSPENAENGMDKNGRPVSGEDAWDQIDSCGGFLGSYLKAAGILDAVGHGLAESIENNNYDAGEARSETVTVWSYVRDKQEK